MILNTILLLIIVKVIGVRRYEDYNNIYGNENDLCPELHVLKPDMHPHQCVSYAIICQGVTQVEVKSEVNGTQHLCHPRFQPWGAGTPTKDARTLHCGFDGGDQLVMEQLSDGHFKYYCKSFTDDKSKKCLITALQQGIFRCQYCKFPYFGFDCQNTFQGFDQRFTNPPRECYGYCLECEDKVSCTKCISGRDNANSNDKTCSIECLGFTGCSIVNNQYQYSNVCTKGTVLNIDRCRSCSQGCQSCTQDQMYNYKRTCDVCNPNYFRERENNNDPNQYACYQIDNCDFSRQQKIAYTTDAQGNYNYIIRCTLCDPGYFYNNQINLCQWVPYKKENCLFLDLAGVNCIACLPWYGLQLDGTCLPITCNSGCLTCLDTNPAICTTCDGIKNRVLDNGICTCKPNHGLLLDICTPCTDGFCYECEMEDYYKCTLCKPGSNRILVNKECICQEGSYDPQNEDQICIVCDYSCLTCSGPSNSQCTQCVDESISNRISNSNSCPCKFGYADFLNKESKCGQCHPKCQTCFQAADETTNQYCLTCIPGQNRVVSDSFNCDCAPNYGDFDGASDICLICDYTCGICNDFGPTHCTSCSESSNRYLTTLGECLCKTSYYDDHTNSIECQRCHYSCLLCANTNEKDSCQQCPLTRIPSDLLATQFECVCASLNTFDDGFQSICQECDYSCLTCNGPLSSNCLTCDKTYRYLDFQSCICHDGYYDIGFLQCEKCHYSCHLCFDKTADTCIACSYETHFRVLKSNICKCADGYYEEPGVALCKRCSYKCETCEIQPDKCLSCPLNSLRIFDPNNGCLCPGEYYDKQDEISCQICHQKCKTCNSYSEESCLTCDEIAYRELNNNQCKCLPHYFEMEVLECAICSAFCYECVDDFENCTSCQKDRYLVGNTCKCTNKFQGAEISTFEFNGIVQCQKCHYSCGICGGVQENDCISCIDSDNRYQDGNKCLCKEGYFDAGLPVCQKCSYKCKACQKQSENCISCQDNSLRQFFQGFNKCQCKSRYYDDGYNEVCQECHYSCFRCNDIKTKCEICSIESNRTYNDSLFTCECNLGYYDAGVEICQKCHYSCYTCNLGNANSCISCVDQTTSKRAFYNNTCKCLFGYFDDGQSTSCKPCDLQCLSCIDQSYQCVSCPQTRKIETNCKCQQGYYDVGLQFCFKCNQLCFTCEFQQDNCTSCDSNQFRKLNLITKKCDCQIGYLEINGVCSQCQQSCKECTLSINNCTSCPQFRYLKNYECICNDGMFESSLDMQCQMCDKTCLTCAYSTQNCLTCSIDNFRIFKSGNTCECIQGYFENQITKNCEECSQSCQTCTLLYDNCLTCPPNLNLYMVNNKCVCQQSYYFDSLTKKCQQCNINCLDCVKSSECASCRMTSRHLDQNINQCLCNDGFYETNSQNCEQCHFSCETCLNINTHCLSCKDVYFRRLSNDKCLCIDGYYEAGIEQCQKCNSICKTCSISASNCLTCFEIEQFRFHSSQNCLCKSGYYETNIEQCSKCSNECLTCQEQSDYCTSCDINSNRIDQSIIHKCPCIIGFYQDQNQICQKCHLKCQNCINQFDQCLSCKFGVNSKRMSLSDQCNCKDGYFDDGNQLQCQKCNNKCKTCENDTNNCNICQSSIRINPPSCNCIDRYYEDEQFICQMCAFKCNTCIKSPQNCLTCKPGRIGIDCQCMDGFFESGQTFCEQCAFQCATCNFNSLNCETCKGNRINNPQCICQSGYFDDQLNEDCQLCDSSCLECNIKGCLSCNANRILNEEMDCVPPPNSIWYDNTPWCSTCQAAVVKAYLSDDISKIIIHFDFPLNSKGFNSQFEINQCLQLFELASFLSFGQNAVCYLNPDSSQEIFIQLGENSKINIGEEILFKNNTISHINCEQTLQKFIFTTLQMPINPIPPLIEYNVPFHKLNPYAENFVYVKSIKNYGNRKLENIIWSFQGVTEETQALVKFLNQNNYLQEYNLLIPRLTLPHSTEIKFKIQFQNFIQIVSTSEFIIFTHSGDLPQININVKAHYFVYEQVQIDLAVGTLNQQNQADNSKYKTSFYEIDRYPKTSSASNLNITIESNSFEVFIVNISKYTLSPNTTYTFQINATNQMNNKYQVQNQTINIPFAGLICQFNNQGIQSIRKDFNLQIECKDLDTRYEWNNDPNLSIKVACKDLTLNKTCQNQQQQMININTTDSVQFINKNSISTFTVQEWTVQAKKFSQSTQFVQIIVYLEDDFPQLELKFNQGYLMRKINNYELLNFTFLIPLSQKSQLLEQSIAIIYNYQIVKIIQPQQISHQLKISNSDIKEFNFGDNINLKFAAQFTNNIMPSLNNIKLTINQPPFCSKLFITRSSNLALTNLIVSTKCEQSNDAPYKYQLRLFLREIDLKEFLQGSSDNSLIFYPFQNSNQFAIQIPTSVDQSTIGVLMQVLDNGGSMTYVYERISSQFAIFDCKQTQYQNLNLQNKISLLFEAMNKKCSELHYLIYLDLLYQQILPDRNENILKSQAIKLYKYFIILYASIQPQNRLLNEENNKICYDQNSSLFYFTLNTTNSDANISIKLDYLKENIMKIDTNLAYFLQIKQQSEKQLLENNFNWNQELFDQFENSNDGFITLIYYIDQIYSTFTTENTKNEVIYKEIIKLLNYINLIGEEIQNSIIVNDKPLVLAGKEIIWQIKRRTKQLFNKQFNINSTQEDYLVDFIQQESVFLQTNPFRFTSDLENIIKNEFNDQKLKIYPENYYFVKLQNVFNSRFIAFENFQSMYSIHQGNYTLCQNGTQKLEEFKLQCLLRTSQGQFKQCSLNSEQTNSTIEFYCECNNFGDVFLISSAQLKSVEANQTQIDFDQSSTNNDNLLNLIIGTSSLTLIFLAIYIFQLFRDYKDKTEINKNDSSIVNFEELSKKKYKQYIGHNGVFKQQFKLIHQTISLFCYKDQYIQFSYRILELFSQFNLFLALTILESFFQSNSISQTCGFIIINPLIVLIMRIFYKIIEAMYRFKKIAAFISQMLLVIVLLSPILVLIIVKEQLYSETQFTFQNEKEQYIIPVIFIANVFLSQIIIEPFTIFGRIFVYRLISQSLKDMELNPIFHFMHFFVMHTRLEEIFDEFTKL